MVAFGQPQSISKVVEAIQKSNDGISQQQIITATGLSERSVKYALKELVHKKLAGFRIPLNDTRRKVYYAEVEK